MKIVFSNIFHGAAADKFSVLTEGYNVEVFPMDINRYIFLVARHINHV